MKKFWIVLSVCWLWTCSEGGDKATGPVEPPIVANFTSDVTSGFQPLEVNFDASLSTGSITNYIWSVNGEVESNSPTPKIIFEETGSYNISLAVSGSSGSNIKNMQNYISVESSVPIVNPVVVTMNEDEPKEVSINAVDPQSFPLSFTIENCQVGSDNTTGNSNPPTIEFPYGNNVMLITPGENYYGTYTCDYFVNNGNFTSETSTITISVYSQDDEPIASNISITIDEDNNASIQMSATEVDNQSFSYEIMSQPQNGVANINSNNKNYIDYTPNQDFYGEDSFDIRAVDDRTSNRLMQATVTVTVNPVNDRPIIQEFQLNLNEDEQLDIDLSQYISDVDNDLSDLTVEWCQSNCSYQIDNNAITINGFQLNYNPSQNFNTASNENPSGVFTGSVQDYSPQYFQILVSDNNDQTLSSRIHISVLPSKDAPIVFNKGGLEYFVPINGNKIFDISYGENNNFISGEGNFWPRYYEDFTISITGNPINGNIDIFTDGVGNKSYTYNPDTDFFGEDSLEISVSDGEFTSSGKIKFTSNFMQRSYFENKSNSQSFRDIIKTSDGYLALLVENGRHLIKYNYDLEEIWRQDVGDLVDLGFCPFHCTGLSHSLSFDEQNDIIWLMGEGSGGYASFSKLDGGGNLIFKKSITSLLSNNQLSGQPYSVDYLSSGGALITGMFSSTNNVKKSLIKVDENGSLINQMNYTVNGVEMDSCNEIIKSSDNGFLLSCGNGYLIKIDQDLALDWHFIYDSSGNTRLEHQKIIENSNQEFIIVGNTYNDYGKYDGYFMKVDIDGNFENIVFYENDVHEHSSGNFDNMYISMISEKIGGGYYFVATKGVNRSKPSNDNNWFARTLGLYILSDDGSIIEQRDYQFNMVDDNRKYNTTSAIFVDEYTNDVFNYFGNIFQNLDTYYPTATLFRLPLEMQSTLYDDYN